MNILQYGNPNASVVLIQPVDEHDLSEIDTEIEEIKKRVNVDFQLLAVKVNSWNHDLSPWRAPAVFGKEDFGDGAADLLQVILEQCSDNSRTYYIGGYSLAGLFSLWAACQTYAFAGAAAVSPSVWFPGFMQYISEHEMLAGTVYLSLGDREEKTKNPIMATVGHCIKESKALLERQGIETVLEWNQGNHFKDAGLRTAKGFAWVINHSSSLRCKSGGRQL